MKSNEKNHIIDSIYIMIIMIIMIIMMNAMRVFLKKGNTDELKEMTPHESLVLMLTQQNKKLRKVIKVGISEFERVKPLKSKIVGSVQKTMIKILEES